MTQGHCSLDSPDPQAFHPLFDHYSDLDTYAESVGYFLNCKSCSFMIDAGYKERLACVELRPVYQVADTFNFHLAASGRSQYQGQSL